MKIFGDGYVKDGETSKDFAFRYPLSTTEFRRHRRVDNPVHIIGFLSSWKQYLDLLPKGRGEKAFKGKPLDPQLLEKVRINASTLPLSRSWPLLDVAGTGRAAVRANASHEGCFQTG